MRGLIRLIIILLAIVQSVFFWKIKKREPKKILIAHDLLLGDTLLLAPLMKRIDEKYPEAQKFMLSKPLFVPLFKNKPYGFKVLSFNPKSFLDIWGIFCCGPYDLAYIAGDNRYSWLARALGARWIIGIEGDTPLWKNWMVNEVKSFDLKPSTWADMMGRLVDGKDPETFEKKEWLRPDTKKILLPIDISKPYIVCHLGASNVLRFWPHTSWQKLCKDLSNQGFEVILTTGPNEVHLIDQIDPAGIYQSVPGSFSLIEMWALLENAALLVSSDTGIVHLAKIACTPTITLYGPGSNLIHGPGKFWMHQFFEAATIDLYPCRDQKFLFRRKIMWLNRCSRNIKQCKTPGACMEAISPKGVIGKATEILKLTHI